MRPHEAALYLLHQHKLLFLQLSLKFPPFSSNSQSLARPQRAGLDHSHQQTGSSQRWIKKDHFSVGIPSITSELMWAVSGRSGPLRGRRGQGIMPHRISGRLIPGLRESLSPDAPPISPWDPEWPNSPVFNDLKPHKSDGKIISGVVDFETIYLIFS